MVYDPELYDDSELTFLIRLRFPDGQVSEMRCSGPVFRSVGEGMIGDAMIAGPHGRLRAQGARSTPLLIHNAVDARPGPALELRPARDP